MGVCCDSNDIGDPSKLHDMPAPDVSGLKDKYQIWEYRTPFVRAPFLAFKTAVEDAEKVDGEKGFVTLQSLAT
jgi:hypothetical protein